MALAMAESELQGSCVDCFAKIAESDPPVELLHQFSFDLECAVIHNDGDDWEGRIFISRRQGRAGKEERTVSIEEAGWCPPSRTTCENGLAAQPCDKKNRNGGKSA